MEDSPVADGSVPPSSMIPSPGLLPSYLAMAFGELYEEDGLMIMAKGLGWMSLLASFVRFYADVEEGHAALMADESTRSSSSSSRKLPLILVLGLRPVEHEALLSIIEILKLQLHFQILNISRILISRKKIFPRCLISWNH